VSDTCTSLFGYPLPDAGDEGKRRFVAEREIRATWSIYHLALQLSPRVSPRTHNPRLGHGSITPAHSRTRPMENPHNERQAILLQRIVKSVVRPRSQYHPSWPGIRYGLLYRLNATTSFRSLTSASRSVLSTSILIPNLNTLFKPPSLDSLRKSSKRTKRLDWAQISLPSTGRTLSSTSKPCAPAVLSHPTPAATLAR
jgi:hypothetical protein